MFFILPRLYLAKDFTGTSLLSPQLFMTFLTIITVPGDVYIQRNVE